MKHVLNIATVTAANLRRRIMEVYPSLYAAFESMDVRGGPEARPATQPRDKPSQPVAP